MTRPIHAQTHSRSRRIAVQTDSFHKHMVLDMVLARRFQFALLISLASLACSSVWGDDARPASESELAAALRRIETLEAQVHQLGGRDDAVVTQTVATQEACEECSKTADKCDACGGRTAKEEQFLYTVYDGGFVFRPFDSDKTPFEMKINSWFQLRYSAFSSDGPNPGQNEFEFERTRLSFSGFALSRDLEYFFQIDGDDNQTQRLDLLDYYLSYDIGHDEFDLESGRIGIRAGRWKIPFNRSRHTSGLNLQFADRSMAGVFFDIDRSVGMSLYGEAPSPVAPVNWEVALINGIRTNGLRPNGVGDLDRNLGASARVFSDVLGKWGSDFESDLAWHEELAVRLGAGFAFSREDISTGPREAAGQRVVDGGTTLVSILPAGASDYSIFMYAVSADFRFQGWSLSTEYYFRSLGSFAGAAVPNLLDHGFLLQTGYFVIPKKLELMARWSRIIGNSGTLGLNNQSADEVAAGMAWYIKGRNLKLGFDVTRVNSAPINDSAVGFAPGDDGLLFRTQLQFLF
ncbi:MAG: porin [Planctomycetota bacterium]|nr:porin [Planctomycetota bacterium]